MNPVDIDLVQQRRKQVLRLSALGLLAFCVAIGRFGPSTPFWKRRSRRWALRRSLPGSSGERGARSISAGERHARSLNSAPTRSAATPLYVFTYIAMFGVGAQSGSLTIGLVFAVSVAAIFRVVISREEGVSGGAVRSCLRGLSPAGSAFRPPAFRFGGTCP